MIEVSGMMELRSSTPSTLWTFESKVNGPGSRPGSSGLPKQVGTRFGGTGLAQHDCRGFRGSVK
jgi:hypothetical protein